MDALGLAGRETFAHARLFERDRLAPRLGQFLKQEGRLLPSPASFCGRAGSVPRRW